MSDPDSLRVAADQHFERMLDADPRDWDTRLVYADWLEENGHEWRAASQRWMVAEQLAPDLRPTGVSYGSKGPQAIGFEWHFYIYDDIKRNAIREKMHAQFIARCWFRSRLEAEREIAARLSACYMGCLRNVRPD